MKGFEKVLCVRRDTLSLTVGKWYNIVTMSDIPYDFYIYDDWNIRYYFSKDSINKCSLTKDYFITKNQLRKEKIEKLNEICQNS